MDLACRICSGQLRPWLAGGAVPVTPDALAPSRHEPRRHGELLACVECGAVQQPALPPHPELVELYREMADDAYLAEETGRRATAGRLLDRIGAFVPSGRLLDIGCGHGLLLDEARRRGYDAVGLELSRAAARHAREVLSLEVREITLEGFEDPGGFDVVVLADVLEHLDDPIAGLERCIALLRQGGVLCVVTPDPSSLPARLAGGRWWGYLPAHTVVLPRRTLAELLRTRGLVISTEVALVRSFSARRWVGGLAERLGPAGAPLLAVAARIPERLSLSPAQAARLLWEGHRVSKLDFTAQSVRLGPLRVTDASLRKRGSALSAQAQASEDDVRAALPPGIAVQLLGSEGGQVKVRATGGLFGVGASVDAVALASAGKLIARPQGLLLEGFQLTLFSDKHVFVESVGASAQQGPPAGYRLSMRASLR